MTLTQQYLSETVVYGGLEMTRGEMIDDLQRVAASMTNDPTRQKLIVGRYLQGFDS